MHTTENFKIYDAFVKIVSIVLVFAGFCLLCAGIRWQIVMNDFLLAQAF